jgi:xanthine/CO dehydrogenase XdhC/CoxF family maturation factor
MRDARRVRAAFEATRTPTLLATVLRTRGPAYRRAGAMALLDATGAVLAGSVSAGCLEDDVCARAPRVLADGRPERVVYDADGGPFAMPSGCGGTVEVLLEPVQDAEHRQALGGWLAALESLGASGVGGVVLRGRDDGRGGLTRLLATPDGEWWFNAVGGDGLSAAVRGEVRRDAVRAAAVQAADVRRYGGASGSEPAEVAWFPVHPVPVLCIGGAMPDAAPVARHALALDWRVLVVEHRDGRRETFDVPGVEMIPNAPAALAAAAARDPYAAALVMYHAEAADAEALRAVVDAPCGFVGVLGPARRTERLLEGTPLAGAAAWPTWLHAPVGLDVGADDADEIAVSIMAELLAWQRGASGAPLAGRGGPLHAAAVAPAFEGQPVPWPGGAA